MRQQYERSNGKGAARDALLWATGAPEIGISGAGNVVVLRHGGVVDYTLEGLKMVGIAGVRGERGKVMREVAPIIHEMIEQWTLQATVLAAAWRSAIAMGYEESAVRQSVTMARVRAKPERMEELRLDALDVIELLPGSEV